jgi:hypothetical protein
MNFGVNAASEKFQKKVEELTKGINHCVNISDDIIIGGVDDEDHDAKLNEVLRRMEEEEVTANDEKCEMCQNTNHKTKRTPRRQKTQNSKRSAKLSWFSFILEQVHT